MKTEAKISATLQKLLKSWLKYDVGPFQYWPSHLRYQELIPAAAAKLDEVETTDSENKMNHPGVAVVEVIHSMGVNIRHLGNGTGWKENALIISVGRIRGLVTRFRVQQTILVEVIVLFRKHHIIQLQDDSAGDEKGHTSSHAYSHEKFCWI